MKISANILIGLVALEHLWFLILEMFLWQSPIGMKTFNLTPEFAEQSVSLAMNQGLYNGFLVAGLVWSLMEKQRGTSLKIFFLGCVIVAGIFGALTVSSRIFFVQGLPAIIALALLFLSGEVMKVRDS